MQITRGEVEGKEIKKKYNRYSERCWSCVVRHVSLKSCIGFRIFGGVCLYISSRRVFSTERFVIIHFLHDFPSINISLVIWTRFLLTRPILTPIVKSRMLTSSHRHVCGTSLSLPMNDYAATWSAWISGLNPGNKVYFRLFSSAKYSLKTNEQVTILNFSFSIFVLISPI